MPNNHSETIEDPSGTEIKIVEVVPNEWRKNLKLDISGPDTTNPNYTSEGTIKIKTPRHLASFIETINDASVLERFSRIDNGGDVDSFFGTITLQPYNSIVGGLGSYKLGIASYGMIAVSLGTSYYLKFSLESPFETMRGLSEVLAAYV